jgi:acyl carrier protein/pimeloyl-ACP methyl ester carboxylesterase
MASHDNLAAYIQAAHERFAFDNRDVMPAIARFSFSISMFELMSPITAGGTLLVLDRDHVLDPARMARTLGEVTFFHAGPSLLKHLIPHIRDRYSDFSLFSRVRHASSGGDMVPPELLEAMKEIFSEAEVFVIYGCSEISCMGCAYPVPRDGAVVKTYVGRPFDNVVVRVLDPTLQQLPAGVTGEICFSGPGVVKGYLHRPDSMVNKFVLLDGRRFYRTGDMGRLSDDGCLEILGRNDFQVKIRGMRIELGEVEHNLRRAPAVRDGVVVARETAPGAEKSLVAYVVLDRADQANDDETRAARLSAIRRHMVANLPDYMVPATYVELDSLPLNHNMKVDRRALPPPDRIEDRPVADQSARKPRTTAEKRIAAEWSELLRVAEVRLDDNFFELGGDSMSATTFVLGIERDLGVRLEGMEVLRESLEVLAALCDERNGLRTVRTAARPTTRPLRERLETFHFGPAQSLYGVLRRPTGAETGHAVLVCPPVGQERTRAHFVLNKLAKRLADRGLPVLHFDYFGCGDSLGEDIDASLGRWQRDIVSAYGELRSRMGSPIVTALGVRLGGALLCNAANRIELSKLVLWDPVCKGTDYYEEAAYMHQQYMRGTLRLRPTKLARSHAGSEELLGFTFSESALRELRNLAIPTMTSASTPSVEWLSTSHPARQRVLFRGVIGTRQGCRLELLDFDSHWDLIARSEDLLPDAGITDALVGMVLDQPRALPGKTTTVERSPLRGGQASRTEEEA